MNEEIRKERFKTLLEKIDIYPDNSVAIYGTGNHTKILLDYMGEYRNKILCLVDKDTKDSNKYGFNITLLENIIGKINTLIISSDIYQNFIYERIKKFNEKINIIKIYKAEDYVIVNSITYKECSQYWEKDSSKVHGEISEDIFKNYSENINKILQLSNDECVLDVGCGEGSIDFFLKSKCKALYGFDFAQNKLFKAMNKNKDCIYWQQSFINSYKLRNFDKIFSFSVMQYCKPCDIEEFILNSITAIKDEGIVFHLDVPDKHKMHNYYWDNYRILKEETDDFIDKQELIFNDGSYCHDLNFITEICNRNRISVKIIDSECNYRSHLIFTKNIILEKI